MPETVQFYIVTLGCKVNQYESQALCEAWQALGWQQRPSPGEVGAGGVLLVNSCAVTAAAESDVRASVRRLHRENPAAAIWITGCAAQTKTAELGRLPGVTAVISTADKDELLRAPEKWLAPGQNAVSSPPPQGGRAYPAFSISTYQRARPVLKVQDGCSHRCTYCIVPLARGASVSRPPQAVLAEAHRLLKAGFREIIISGINLSQYRAPLPAGMLPEPALPQALLPDTGNDFWGLLAWLEKELVPDWAGQARLRISSLEPGQLHTRALEVLANSRLLCPHLHISLQSGSYSVLSRMGRGHYQPDALPDFCERLRAIWPRFGLGADLLVGFPGETDNEFEETLRLIRALPLTYAHVFPYSPRPGTPAAAMPGRLSKELLTARAAALRQEVKQKKELFLDTLVREGASLQVALEGHNPERGVSEYYTECRFSRPPANAALRMLAGARALARTKESLLVDPLLPPDAGKTTAQSD